ncbi:hypothetical protein ABT144_21210 [Streptomyces sp. NPDC002039]|uniref:hypothetical protein n=1 Tax=Streptomyces sp. NPDC002039 TaxID=3154660 RepID=UPI00331FF97C
MSCRIWSGKRCPRAYTVSCPPSPLGIPLSRHDLLVPLLRTGSQQRTGLSGDGGLLAGAGVARGRVHGSLAKADEQLLADRGLFLQPDLGAGNSSTRPGLSRLVQFRHGSDLAG